jgi:hypothetical protein
MPGNTLDEAFPAVGWTLFAGERLIQRYLIYPRWFHDRLVCARYASIPLCNLQTDALTTMLDVTFGRQLQQGRHLLWIQEGSKYPDLGGSFGTGMVVSTTTLSAGSKGSKVSSANAGAGTGSSASASSGGEELLWEIWSDRLEEPCINEIGIYRTLSVELEIRALAISAIMNSLELDETMSLHHQANSRGGANPSASAGVGVGVGVGGSKGEGVAAEGVMNATSGHNNNSSLFSDASCIRTFK